MEISIKKRIYWSFLLLVSLFVINGIITIVTLNSIKKLSAHLSNVVDPSIQSINDFKKMMIESKMYSTNWVFLRANQQDKDLLKKLHDSDYNVLRSRVKTYYSQWTNNNGIDSLNKVFADFEQLLNIEKDIMLSLNKFEDYDDPVLRFEAERKIDEEILPRTSSLIATLNIVNDEAQRFRKEENNRLEHSSMRLSAFIIALVITIICIGIFLSFYMAQVIISPINKIRYIINDLGKGIIRKVNHKAGSDEIGEMVHSVNSLSQKLQATATFAHEVGLRNFNIPFQPLSNEDTLGTALISMRDNLKFGDERLNQAQHIAHLGSWEWDLKTSSLFWSDELFKIFNEDPATFTPSFEAFLNFVHPEDKEMVNGFVSSCLVDQLPFTYECRIVSNGGMSKVIFAQGQPSVNDQGEITKMSGIAQDITERKKAEANLEAKNKELEIKNRELEQFAYVASHDLQEPLRTTSSFADLLQKQYSDKLDEKANKYLGFITHSSDRMKVLIKDLLDYSRIGRQKELEQVDCNEVLSQVLQDLNKLITDEHAIIQALKLPVVSGYPTEIQQLFQNLVMNAIKFRKKTATPKIKISAKLIQGNWQFAIKDNGIGIKEEHNERIFIIFQRLHTRGEYSGSGIGLSHCKKIVELHGGKIWVDSIPGDGSTFNFTLPARQGITNGQANVPGMYIDIHQNDNNGTQFKFHNSN